MRGSGGWDAGADHSPPAIPVSPRLAWAQSRIPLICCEPLIPAHRLNLMTFTGPSSGPPDGEMMPEACFNRSRCGELMDVIHESGELRRGRGGPAVMPRFLAA